MTFKGFAHRFMALINVKYKADEGGCLGCIQKEILKIISLKFARVLLLNHFENYSCRVIFRGLC